MKTVLYAYLAQAKTSSGVPGFGRTHVNLATDEQLKGKIRSQAGSPGAEVVIVSPDEWKPPQFNSVSQQELMRNFPAVMDRVTRHMAKAGLPRMSQQTLIREGTVMPNPVSGRVIFVYKVKQPEQ